MSTVPTSGSSAQGPTRRDFSRAAGAFLTDEGLIEKDWHVVRALAALVPLSVERGARLVFCGGTSLSKGWGLIKRFSEDIDFRIWCDEETASRALCRAIRDSVDTALLEAAFVPVKEHVVRDASRFVEMNFGYGGTMKVPAGLREHLKVELTMERPRLSPVARPIQSFVSTAKRQAPEVPAMLCLDPVEIAAEKFSAFGWRALNRKRGHEGDDPSVVRHLYDLALLLPRAEASWAFRPLATEVVRIDAGRGREERPREPGPLAQAVASRMQDDAAWRQEYTGYIHQVGYGPEDELLSFDSALEAYRQYERMFA